MQIFAKTTNDGRTVVVEVEPATTILNVKKLVRLALGIKKGAGLMVAHVPHARMPANEGGVLFDGHVMVDQSATLFKLGIGPGSTIEIFGMAG
eukprot:8450707-Alexandrium_andersonii.AAC.1